MKSPSQLARTHCANWIGHGTCVGTDIDPKTGIQRRWRPEDSPCLVSEGRRCPYLEGSVLPMENWKWNTGAGVAFANAANQYRIEIAKEKPTDRPSEVSGLQREHDRPSATVLCRVQSST